MKITSIIAVLTFSCLNIFAQEKVLVFTKTAGFRHLSINVGIEAIEELGEENNFQVTHTENAAYFNTDSLAQYDAVVFLLTTGNILDETQQLAFENYIQSGGGYVGIHSASDTEYQWPWYGELVGSFFDSHPLFTSTGTVQFYDRVHPSTKNLPERWQHHDEWYSFQDNPRGKVHVLATVDENTYNTFGATEMGFDHPISWCQQFDGGRSWYTGLGHTNQSYSNPVFLEHILGGIKYASGATPGNFEASDEDNFDLTVIDDDVNTAIAVEVLPDLRVVYIERIGTVKIYDPTLQDIVVAANVPVDYNREDGLIGIVADPNFEDNNSIYLFYSLPDTALNVVSRFTLGADNVLDLNSEQRIIDIPMDRNACCHSGGDLEFDGDGNLYIATGDNTSPFFADGYSPIDEQEGNAYLDAQRTSSNTKNLSGKILRIKPHPTESTYTIPDGNLFADPNEGYPEIFVMGTRNPFRIAVSKSGTLVWGDIGPDALANTARGPKGYDEFNKTDVAGNFGWPYCIANNQSYADYDYATNTNNGMFDCDMPINESSNNNGSILLPPAQPAWIYYPYGESTLFPEFNETSGGLLNGFSRSSMAGPIYHFDSTIVSDIQFPPYFNNSIFLIEWTRSIFREVKLDDFGNILEINPIFVNFSLPLPIDMTIGPDGAFYILTWGDYTTLGTEQAEPKLVRIGYRPGNKSPVAKATLDAEYGSLPLTVNFDGSESYDPDLGDSLTYEWDVFNDGSIESEAEAFSYTFTEYGTYDIKLTVKDRDGLTSFDLLKVTAGNNIALLYIQKPISGGMYSDGDTIEYAVEVYDEEDGSTTDNTIDCEHILNIPAIGHDDHVHDGNSLADCVGTFNTESHGGNGDNIFYLLTATYEDQGAFEANSLEASASVKLQSKHMNLEYYVESNNVNTLNPYFLGENSELNDYDGGGSVLTSIQHNGYVAHYPVNLQNINYITFRAGAILLGAFKSAGWIEVRADSVNGELLAKRYIPNGWVDRQFDYFTAPIKDPGGTRKLFFTFQKDFGNQGIGQANLFDVNWAEFYGDGISVNNVEANEGAWAKFYNNNDLTNLVTLDKHPMISFNYEENAPLEGVNSDEFTIQWKAGLIVPKDGRYKFRLDYLNGSYTFMLNDSIISSKVGGSQFTSDFIDLYEDSTYVINLNYTHRTGDAKMELRWRNFDGEVPFYNVIHQNYLTMKNINPDVDVTTSIFQESVENLRLYPNPTSKFFTIENQEAKIASIQVYDAIGNMLIQRNNLQSLHSILVNIETLNSGTYFVHMFDEHNNEAFKKVIKLK